MESLVEQLKPAYAGKRVLVTGHNGFKGSWLVALLEYLGAEVYGVSLVTKEDSPFKNFHTLRKGSSYIQDIRDFKNLSSLINDINPELVFHLAAQALVLESYKIPRETFEINVQGTVNLLDSISTSVCRGVVVVTTDKVYKNDNTGKIFKESDELWGHDPYSFSKSAAEFAVAAWRNLPSLKECALITVRAGNVFGPGDRSHNRLLPDLLKGVRTKSVTEIRNPDGIRPWQYVLDPLVGYLLLGLNILEGKLSESSYNFGPNEDSFISVSEFVAKLKAMIPVRIQINKSEQDLESKILKLDSRLAKNDLNWYTMTSLELGLTYTVELDLKVNDPKFILNHVESFLSSAQSL